MTIEEFVARWTNKACDFDGVYGNQCMDLMHQYVYDVLGLTDAKILQASTAYLAYAGFNWPQYFVKIENTPTGVPQKGDIMFWNTGVGSAGHVAIFLSGNVNQFNSFDQNWPVKSLPHIQLHNYDYVAGWLRPKITTVPEVDYKKLYTEVLDKLNKIKEVLK